MIRQGKKIVALTTVGVLLLGACRSSGKAATPTTQAPATTTTVAGGAATTTSTASTAAPGTTTAGTTGGTTAATTGSTAAPDTTVPTTEAAKPWAVDTSTCDDPSKATAPITGTLTIGSAQPLTGPVAGAFAPVTDGLNLYFDYANAQKLLPGITLKPAIGDDQYDPTKTPGVVSGLIDSGVNIFTGIIGTEDNDAVRDTLNKACIPQLNALSGSPEWGNDVAHFPWTTGALVPYDIEAQIYADKIKETKPGATVGLFSVNNDFGKVFHDAFKAAADKDGLKIVDDQTIEPADQAPPTNQVGSIAKNKPDTVVTVPLGLQCPIFLKELVNQEAVNTGWKPVVYMTNTCGSRLLISALAAGAGDGVYTSSNLIDPQDPKNADNAGYKTFKAAYDAKGLKGDIATTATGWAVGEITVQILIAAQKSGTLSRESIINAARNLTFVPTLARDGTVYKMNGLKDTFPFQSLTVVQWNQAAGLYTDIGAENTSFES